MGKLEEKVMSATDFSFVKGLAFRQPLSDPMVLFKNLVEKLTELIFFVLCRFEPN